MSPIRSGLLHPARCVNALLLLLLATGCGGDDARTDPGMEAERSATRTDFEPLDLPAPEYTASDRDGNPVSLADFRGDVVLLNVWATWCAPCRVEMPDLQRLHEELEPQGLRVVGVSIDGARSEGTIDGFLEQVGVDFLILRDPEDRISGLLSAHAVPLTILIDRQGRMQWRHMGPVTYDDPDLRAALEMALQAVS